METQDKAKTYDEVLKKARMFYKDEHVDNEVNSLLEVLFPELKESEDEKIRKAIHIYFDWLDGRKDYQPKGEYTIRDMIAWFEKQGEQKFAEWSKEDEAITLQIEQIMKCASFLNIVPDKLNKINKWIKSLKQRIIE